MHCIVYDYWNAIHEQRFDDVRALFHETAQITWPNTQVVFMLDDFIYVNEVYPGEWEEEVLHIYEANDILISEASVKGKDMTFLTIGIFQIRNGKIADLREYWTAVEEIPQWRKELLKQD